MATSSNRRAVVFDLDGTLVEVSARDYAVYRDVLSTMASRPCRAVSIGRCAARARNLLRSRAFYRRTGYLHGELC